MEALFRLPQTIPQMMTQIMPRYLKSQLVLVKQQFVFLKCDIITRCNIGADAFPSSQPAVPSSDLPI